MRKPNMKTLINKSSLNRQQGATLITALMMLLVMTVLGIAAIKMTSISIIIAGNDQQKLMLMQQTETNLINLATPAKLIDPLIKVEIDGVTAEFDDTTNEYVVLDPRSDSAQEIITYMATDDYTCQGFGGKAITQSPEIKCRLYDFQIRARGPYSGAREIRRRGAGKEVPSRCKNSFLCS